MPVQERGTAPVERGGGLIPPVHPLTGPVELRVHGVGGTPPAQLLSDLSPDQVAGDKIAGFYRTVDDEHGRHIEAYSWGGLTSRSSFRVLWILMLPFALSNLAGWMCQPSVARSKARFLVHRFIARAAGLLLTLNVVTLLLMIGEDLIAVRCRGATTCTSRLRPVRLLNEHVFIAQGGAHFVGRAMAVGAFLPVLAVLVFDLLSRASARLYERAEPAVQAAATGRPKVESAAGFGTSLDSPKFWNGYGSARRLSGLHTAAAIAFVAAVLALTAQRTVAPAQSAGWTDAVTAVGAAIIALALILLAVDTAPPWIARVLLGLSVIAFAAAVWLAWALQALKVPPADVVKLRYVANGMWAAQAVIIIGSVLLAFVSRRNVDTFPRPATALVSLLAIGIVNAFGSLVIILIAGWIAAPAPSSTRTTTQARDLSLYAVNGKIATWIICAVIVVTVLLAIAAVIGWLAAGGAGQRQEIRAEYVAAPGTPEPASDKWMIRKWDDGKDADTWLRSIARFRFLAKALRQLGRLLLIVIPAALLTTAVVEFRYWTGAGITPLHWMTTGAGWLALALPALLVFLLRLGWRNLGARRGIGVVWDVATFWPRAYHPYAPPCYAERAVPELGRRLSHLEANGAEVTVAAHSQGAIVAAAALLQRASGQPADVPPGQAAQPQPPVGLVTFGAPLDTLYRWAFPAYFDRASLLWIGATGAPTEPGEKRQWTNFYYQTDYVGRTWTDGAHNQCLTDPPTARYVYQQPRAAIGTHSGYWHDARVWAAELNPDPACWRPAGCTELDGPSCPASAPTVAGLRSLVDDVEKVASAARLARLHLELPAAGAEIPRLTVLTEGAAPPAAVARFTASFPVPKPGSAPDPEEPPDPGTPPDPESPPDPGE
jgi:hypothetical protein